VSLQRAARPPSPDRFGYRLAWAQLPPVWEPTRHRSATRSTGNFPDRRFASVKHTSAVTVGTDVSGIGHLLRPRQRYAEGTSVAGSGGPATLPHIIPLLVGQGWQAQRAGAAAPNPTPLAAPPVPAARPAPPSRTWPRPGPLVVADVADLAMVPRVRLCRGRGRRLRRG